MMPATAAAARTAGLPADEAFVLQTAHRALLAAAARGEIDLNQMAREELAARGLDATGQWVGFPAAQAALLSPKGTATTS